MLLEPGDVTWVDVLLPTSHHRWTTDVSSSAWWLGEVWRRTLAELGATATAVHVGPMVTTPWSSRLCFAGVGGGELIATVPDGDTDIGAISKIVGISQRRTRSGARFQCALYRHWRPERHVGLFAEPSPTAAEIADLVTSIDAPLADVRTAFMAHLALA